MLESVNYLSILKFLLSKVEAVKTAFKMDDIGVNYILFPFPYLML